MSLLLRTHQPTLILAFWVSDLSTWLPEGNGIGTNNQWVTLRVDCSGPERNTPFKL